MGQQLRNLQEKHGTRRSKIVGNNQICERLIQIRSFLSSLSLLSSLFLFFFPSGFKVGIFLDLPFPLAFKVFLVRTFLFWSQNHSCFERASRFLLKLHETQVLWWNRVLSPVSYRTSSKPVRNNRNRRGGTRTLVYRRWLLESWKWMWQLWSMSYSSTSSRLACSPKSQGNKS